MGGSAFQPWPKTSTQKGAVSQRLFLPLVAGVAVLGREYKDKAMA